MLRAFKYCIILLSVIILTNSKLFAAIENDTLIQQIEIKEGEEKLKAIIQVFDKYSYKNPTEVKEYILLGIEESERLGLIDYNIQLLNALSQIQRNSSFFFFQKHF